MKSSINTIASHLARWYTQPLGQRLWIEEQKQAAALLAKPLSQFTIANNGPIHGLQISEIISSELLYTHPAPTQLNIWHLQCNLCQPTLSLYAEADTLPFLDHCMTVVLLHHILEFAENPHQVLRETRRVLAPEGYLLLIGFTHYSLWGLVHQLLRNRGQAPWNGQFLSLLRMRDWLELLDFEILAIKYCFYRPPLQSHRLLSKLDRFDWIERHLPFMAADYMILAQKRVWPLTPIRPRWQTTRALFPSALPVPSSRQSTT